MANAQTVERKWYVVDADGMTLGRLASQVAAILRGKNKPTYTPHCDTGDHVIVINAAKVVLTGKKLDQKVYYHHSGYVGGLKETKYSKLMAEKPEFAVKHAILGMMPKGPLGTQTETVVPVSIKSGRHSMRSKVIKRESNRTFQMFIYSSFIFVGKRNHFIKKSSVSGF